MTFIQVTDSEDDAPIYVNPNTISAVYYYDKIDCTIIHLVSGENFAIKESPETVMLLARLKGNGGDICELSLQRIP